MNTNLHTALRVSLGVVTLLLIGVRSSGSSSTRHELDFDQRVAAQRAIEAVYWRHRLWPKENPTPKPALSDVMPDDAIRAKVEDYLRKSNALETWWQRPVTAAQLQAELGRISKWTRNPQMLQELQVALGNDSALIAETLARPALVDRLIRNWYASDDRFHGALEQQVRQVLEETRTVAEMKAMGGEYNEQKLRRLGDDEAGLPEPAEHDALELSSDEWKARMEELANQFGTAPEALPVQRLSALNEDRDRFFVTAVLSVEPEAAIVATVGWPKRSFEDWWSEVRGGTPVEVETAAASYAIPASKAGGCVDDTWEQPLLTVPPRSSAPSVWTGAEMIVWGGGGNTNTGFRYDPATDTWTATSVGAGVPSPRTSHTVVWTGTEMIVWGGGSNLNTGGRYDPAVDQWVETSTGANVPSGRYGHTAVWAGTEMIVWGGYVGGNIYPNTGGRYDPAKDEWTPTATSTGVPEGRQDHTVVWTGTQMIVWGGRGSGGAYSTAGGRYEPATDQWSPTATAGAPAPRYSHTAVWTGDELIVWGGWGGAVLNSGGRYDPDADQWTPTPTSIGVPSQRQRHTAVWTGTEMIVWGGSTQNTGGRYDPASGQWTPTSTSTGVPSQRSDHTAVWTGAEMIVWGGSYYDFLSGVEISVNTGGRYDPGTNSWIATSTGANAPWGRSLHTAVWTGAEMIVWGGWGGGSLYFETGGRYDPTTDTWVSTTWDWMRNVPARRAGHTAVWTGLEMIVWGGHGNDDAYYNTGGRYRPMEDYWYPTSTGGGVPSARGFHSAVWTGTEMIVWGGRRVVIPNTIYLNDGGRYNPGTNGWSSTAGVGVTPSARTSHTAIWTGTEMIVWGGTNSSSCQNTGGRYKPQAGTWTATSTGANVPSARYLHTAVWTGTEMIVWGGGCGFSGNTGGRYDIAANSWLPTSAGANVPSARAKHSAIWTVSEMIIWGGPGNTGSRFSPAIDGWAPMSTGANVPPGRDSHTAIWTGAQMIVWGGVSVNGDPGLYCTDGCADVPDSDGDGVGELCDACPDDPLNDSDGDSVCGDLDNCPIDTNPEQIDTDGDSIGDACEGCLLFPVYADADGDGRGDPDTMASACAEPPGYSSVAGDCDDNDGFVWSPGEVQDVRYAADKTTLSWTAPVDLGGASPFVGYDTIRSATASDFNAAATCLESDDPTDLVAVDPWLPSSGIVFYYLARAENECGLGSVGNASSGPRPQARECP